MLRSNSKAVKEKVRAYLKDEVFAFLEERQIAGEKPYTEYMNTIRSEKKYQKYRSDFEMFQDWLQGLGGYAMGADIYCHVSERGRFAGKVADILQDWLSETDEEIQKYDTERSENLMLNLCWREFQYLIRKENEGGKVNV